MEKQKILNINEKDFSNLLYYVKRIERAFFIEMYIGKYDAIMFKENIDAALNLLKCVATDNKSLDKYE